MTERFTCARFAPTRFSCTYQELPVPVFKTGPDDRCILSLSDHGLLGRDSVRSKRAQVAERLDQVGLPLSVTADEEVRPRTQGDVRRRVVPEVGEIQLTDDQFRLVRLFHRVAAELLA